MRIRDPESFGPLIRDPGWKNSDPESGIRDKDPGSATLLPTLFSYLTLPVTTGYELCVLQDIYKSAEYCHPLLDSVFVFFLPPAITDIFSAVNCFRVR
jgi:hypothetical protein